MKKWLPLLLLCAWACAAQAIDPLPFRDPQEAQRFQHLVAQLRCTVCQNQNLADSDADLAKDLRRKVYELMQSGRSDAQIKQYLVERYGDFVLYDPPFKPLTWLLWLGPFGVLALGALQGARVLARRARQLGSRAQPIDDDQL